MYNNQIPFVIGSIDTVYLGTEARKRYWSTCVLPTYGPQFVIEGIGFEMGFWDQYSVCQTLADISASMVCYQKHGDTLVLDPIAECGTPAHNPLVGIEDEMSHSLEVRWEAGRSTLFFVQMPNDRAFQWQVVDARGGLIRRGEGLPEQIALPELAQGMYLFWANDGRSQKAYRFLKL